MRTSCGRHLIVRQPRINKYGGSDSNRSKINKTETIDVERIVCDCGSADSLEDENGALKLAKSEVTIRKVESLYVADRCLQAQSYSNPNRLRTRLTLVSKS